jgi:hypothetical protein
MASTLGRDPPSIEGPFLEDPMETVETGIRLSQFLGTGTLPQGNARMWSSERDVAIGDEWRSSVIARWRLRPWAQACPQADPFVGRSSG